MADLYQEPRSESFYANGCDMSLTSPWQLLIVDDEPQICEQVKKFLQGELLPGSDTYPQVALLHNAASRCAEVRLCHGIMAVRRSTCSRSPASPGAAALARRTPNASLRGVGRALPAAQAVTDDRFLTTQRRFGQTPALVGHRPRPCGSSDFVHAPHRILTRIPVANRGNDRIRTGRDRGPGARQAPDARPSCPLRRRPSPALASRSAPRAVADARPTRRHPVRSSRRPRAHPGLPPPHGSLRQVRRLLTPCGRGFHAPSPEIFRPVESSTPWRDSSVVRRGRPPARRSAGRLRVISWGMGKALASTWGTDGAKPIAAPTAARGYRKLFLQAVTQADCGVDFDFLRAASMMKRASLGT